jgi:hypothetical protein
VAYRFRMSALTAHDLWPLVQKLSRDEQVRLARLALHAAAATPGGDLAAYQAAPSTAEEFGADGDDPLAWESDGWDDVDAPG